MDTTFETAADFAAAHSRQMARVFGDDPKPYYDSPCCDCHQDVPELIEVPGYGRCCPRCSPAAIAFVTAAEPVQAEILSACCGAAMRSETFDHGTCPETGYRDAGECLVCLTCGDEAEPVLRAAPIRKTVAMTRELLHPAEGKVA